MSSYRFDLSCEAGFEQATPTFDEAPARVDEQCDEQCGHYCANEKTQLGSCTHSLCDESHDDPCKSGVDHRYKRGRTGEQAVEPALRARAVRLVQASLIVVMARDEVRLEPRCISR